MFISMEKNHKEENVRERKISKRGISRYIFIVYKHGYQDMVFKTMGNVIAQFVF
jgi:hypothetical protein